VVRLISATVFGVHLPLSTGAIDNWRNVKRDAPFSIDDQFGWKDLRDHQLDTLDAANRCAAPIPEDVERIPVSPALDMADRSPLVSRASDGHVIRLTRRSPLPSP